MIVFDSYAWIEYFLGSDNGRTVREYLNTEEVVTPSIVLAEIARKYLRDGMEQEDVVKRLNFISANSTIIEINAELSLAAAKAYLELSEKAKVKQLRRPSLTDGIILASAKALGAKIVTGDEHFKGLTETVYIG